MPTRTLSESFDVSGEWHVPENPTRIISGRLHYTQERTELHLNEAFQPVRGSIRAGDPLQSYPLVYGTTTDGEAMTLLRAQRLGVSLNFGSGGLRQPEKLLSSWLLVGAHMPVDFAYSEMSFRVPGLQIWLSRKIIEQSIDNDQDSGRMSQTYRVLPVERDITHIPSIDATLEWSISWNSSSDPFSSISVGVFAWITIRPATPQGIEWYFEQQAKIAAMLAFLAGTPMSPDCIEASIGEPHHKISVMVAMRDARYCTYRNLHDFFMTRGGMKVDLSEVVASWFETYPMVHMPSQLALSILASERLWLHIEFLSLMQALEGLHRGLCNGNYMDDVAYESVKKALGDAIPGNLGADHKDALRSRIRYGNQVSLRKRLDALAGVLSSPLRCAVIGGDGKIPRSWIDTRNYYTHWDEELRTNVLDGQGMYYANVRMRLFVRAIYLELMGIPQEAIFQSLSNASDTSQHLAQLNATERRRVDPNDSSGVIMTLMEQPADGCADSTLAPNEDTPPHDDTAIDADGNVV